MKSYSLPLTCAQRGKRVAERKIQAFAPLLPGNHAVASWRDSLRPYVVEDQKMFISLANLYSFRPRAAMTIFSVFIIIL